MSRINGALGMKQHVIGFLRSNVTPFLKTILRLLSIFFVHGGHVMNIFCYKIFIATKHKSFFQTNNNISNQVTSDEGIELHQNWKLPLLPVVTAWFFQFFHDFIKSHIRLLRLLHTRVRCFRPFELSLLLALNRQPSKLASIASSESPVGRTKTTKKKNPSSSFSMFFARYCMRFYAHVHMK